jgi:hypothetical protein
VSDIASGLMFFWMIRGQAAEGLAWYEATLNLPCLPPDAEAKALIGAALLWFSRGELGRARSALTRALSLTHTTCDMNMVMRAVGEDVSARVELGVGDLTAARYWFLRAIESFTALGLPWGAGNALIGMSAIPLEIDDAHQAKHILDEATSMLQDAGPWFLARALLIRAILAVRRGAPGEAIMFVRQSLTHIRDLHDKYAFVHAAVPLAAAAALNGDDSWAARVLAARDIVSERTGATVVFRPVRALSEQVERDVRGRLGSDRWSRAYAAGRQASIDSLLKDIDGALSRGVSD